MVLASQDALVKEVKPSLTTLRTKLAIPVRLLIDILEVYLKNKLDAVTGVLDTKLNATSEQVQTL